MLKRFGLFKWFFAGVIVGFILGVAMEFNSGWDGGVSISVMPFVCGFAFLAFRKWIFKMFWA